MLCHWQRLITVVSKFVILYVRTVLSRLHLILYGLCNKVTVTCLVLSLSLSFSFLVLGGSCAGVSVSLQSVSNPSLPKLDTKVLS